jgi:hypothetical protein
MRPKTKVRDGAKVKRKYDTPLPAYQRVLETERYSKKNKTAIARTIQKTQPEKVTFENHQSWEKTVG